MSANDQSTEENSLDDSPTYRNGGVKVTYSNDGVAQTAVSRVVVHYPNMGNSDEVKIVFRINGGKSAVFGICRTTATVRATLSGDDRRC